MHLKPLNINRRLPAYDEQEIERLLKNEYRSSEFTAMGYGYPMNDNRLVLEYAIDFFGNGKPVHFLRNAFKKNGQWKLSDDFHSLAKNKAGKNL